MCNQRDSIQSIHQKEKNGKIEIRTNNIPYSCYKFVKDPVPNSLQNLVDFEFENRYIPIIVTRRRYQRLNKQFSGETKEAKR